MARIDLAAREVDAEGVTTAAWLHLFIDVPRPALPAATRFWAAVTGSTPSEPRGEHGQFVSLMSPVGDPWVRLQGVERNDGGIHLDVECDDVAETAARATDLGAHRVGPFEDVEVLRSPGGLPFCLARGREYATLGRSGDAVLDQVCIDIPVERWESEVSFWQALTGREVESGPRPEFAYLAGPVSAPRILLQRVVAPGEPVRAHPDFAVGDRAAATARHLEAGADLLVEFDWWTVMCAPGGQVYCLTERDPATGNVGEGAFA